jgi:subtilase family serine protease
MKRYLVTILQNNKGVQIITVYSSTKLGAERKALKLFKEGAGIIPNITASAKHSDFFGNEIPENINRYNYSIPYTV